MRVDTTTVLERLNDAWVFAQRKPAVAAVLLILINLPLLQWLTRRFRSRGFGWGRGRKAPINYLFPTVCSELPSLGRSALARGDNEVSLSPDDWCQIEFVPRDNRAQIDRVLKRIGEVLSRARDGGGFTVFPQCISRPAFDVPFDRLSVTLEELREGLRAPEPKPLYLWESATGASVYQIEGGFVLPIPSGGYVYGVAFQGLVVKLGCIARGMSSDSLYELSVVPKLRNALLVDWLHGRVVQVGENH